MSRIFLIFAALCIPSAMAATPANLMDPPYFSAQVASGELPPVADRIPAQPAVVELDPAAKQYGEYGGRLRMLMGKSKDIRMLMVYGYARLVGYDAELNLAPDILRAIDVKDQREFTLHLRAGHKWSDGAPFTSDAFEYYWNDVVNNADLYPFGLPQQLLVDGAPPRVEFIDAVTIRYTWAKSNPHFLTALAAPRPLFLYAPGHYLKQFHLDYAPAEELQRKINAAGARNWAGLHHRKNHPYKNDNPDLPVLQPWVNTTAPPAERFIFQRNPFYHRVDARGRQLPYIDEVAILIASSSLIAAKTAAGEADLQARYLRLDDYTFLKAGERRHDFSVKLWRAGGASKLAVYLNLNSKDAEWRQLARDPKFRRALSLGINRFEINQVIYFGLAREANNNVLVESPLYKADYQTAWSSYNVAQANQLLDDLGLQKRDRRGLRLMPAVDGQPAKPLEIILHTAGESTEETDVLELIGASWLQLGIKLHTKPSQREVFRERIFAGDAMAAMFNGLDNGLPTADMSPAEFAPTSQTQLQWPKWGQHFESNGKVGAPPDIPAAQKLLAYYQEWNRARSTADRERIWHAMLDIYSQQVFSIGIIAGAPQPVVVADRLQNVPAAATWSWLPTSYFGVHKPDTFWFEK